MKERERVSSVKTTTEPFDTWSCGLFNEVEPYSTLPMWFIFYLFLCLTLLFHDETDIMSSLNMDFATGP